MTISLTHAKVSSITDDATDSAEGDVLPSDWNAQHTLTQATGKLLGRTTASTGATEEITPDSTLSFSAGALGVVNGDLTKTDDTNVTLTLGGTPTGALLKATSVTVGWTGTLAATRLNANVVQGVTNDTNVTGSIATQNLTLGWTGQLGLTRGGTNASLTASNGGIFYSTASAAAILAGTATAQQMLQSGASGTPAWSTATWPATTTINQFLYSSAANVVSGLSSANGAVPNTDSTTGVPVITATPVLGVNGSYSGTIGLRGSTSGLVTIQPQAVAGTTNLTAPTTSGTLAASATAPITLNSTTGAIGITGSALTKVDDTNVTLTLGGSPTSALLSATSITVGWTGTLANSRLATMANNTIKGNNTGSTASPSDLSVADVQGMVKSARYSIYAQSINFNSANTDTAITVTLPTGFTRYFISAPRITHASASITTATVGFFTGAGGTGTAIVTGGTAVTVSASADNTNNNGQFLTQNNAGTQTYTATTLYFRIGTAQGSAATADFSFDILPEL